MRGERKTRLVDRSRRLWDCPVISLDTCPFLKLPRPSSPLHYCWSEWRDPYVVTRPAFLDPMREIQIPSPLVPQSRFRIALTGRGTSQKETLSERPKTSCPSGPGASH